MQIWTRWGIFGIATVLLALPVHAGPIIIDLNRTSPDVTFYGANRGDGLVTIAVGDFNGDGVKDILLGAPNAKGKLGERGAGAAYIILGLTNLSSQVDLEAVGSRITIFGCHEGDRLGTAVAAGDVNGDGIDDILLGAPGADGPDVNGDGVEDRPNSGEVYVIFGRADLFFGGKFNICGQEQDVTIFGADLSDNLGTALAVKDINKDSFMDIVIGAPLSASTGNARPGAGEAYVVFGRPFLRPVFPTCLAPGLARCMDMAGALGPGPAVVLYGAETGDMLGTAVASGDVNKDGFIDLIVGAPLADGPNNARASAGEAYIIMGSRLVGKPLPITIDIGATQQDVTIYGANPFDQLGTALATGDVNHDSMDDVMVGAPGADGPDLNGDGKEDRPNAGEAYVLLGRASFPPALDIDNHEQDVTIYGADISDGLGASIAAGQIGQDELDDILIGAPGTDSWGNARPRAGEAYIILGHPAWSPGLSRLTIDTCLPPLPSGIINCAANVARVPESAEPDIIFFGASTGDRLGSATYIGDVTGETIADIFLGAPNGDGLAELRDNSGEVYLILGSPALENKPPKADAGPDQPPPTVCVGKPVQLNGSNSSDPEHGMLLFQWEFTQKPTGSLVPDPQPIATPTFIPDKPGRYVLQLTVDDGFGVRSPQQKDTVTITAITCGPPKIEAPPFAFLNDHIVMRAVVNGSVDAARAYRWEFVCAPSLPGPPINNPGQAEASFFPIKPGLYCVKVTVDSPDGSPAPQQTAEAKITVGSLSVSPIRPALKVGQSSAVVDLDFGCARPRSYKTKPLSIRNETGQFIRLHLTFETGGSVFRKRAAFYTFRPGQTKSIRLGFRPPAAGSFSATLQMLIVGPGELFQPRLYELGGSGGCFSLSWSASGAEVPSSDRSEISVIAPSQASDRVEVAAVGSSIASLQVELFTLTGQKVLDRETASSRLEFALVNRWHQPLARGVYLYIVTVRDGHGQLLGSRIGKLVIFHPRPQ